MPSDRIDRAVALLHCRSHLDTLRSYARQENWPRCRMTACRLWTEIEQSQPFPPGRQTWMVNTLRSLFAGTDHHADTLVLGVIEALVRDACWHAQREERVA